MGRVVQVSVDIHIEDNKYNFDFEEKIRELLENAGYEVPGIMCETS